MPTYLLWLIVAVEGFAALAAQMLAIRQLMPFVGNSIIVTSLIIGIFLFALAIGYWQGGQVNHNPVKRLARNFTLSAIWLGIGLSYIFLAYWFLGGKQTTGLNLYVLLIAYLLLVTTPQVYWLGQTVPMVMNLWQTSQRAGEIGGRVLQLSTLGSFLGAIVTSVVLMNILGLGWTVFIVACLLLSLAWLLTLREWYWGLSSIGYLLLIAALYSLNVLGTNTLFVATNHYAQYQVIDDFCLEKQTGKALLINQSLSSFLTQQRQAALYIEQIKRVVFDDLKLQGQSILVLGAGGFTFSAQGTHANQITYVDIDPDIARIVKKHYLNPIHGKFIAADARVFVQQTHQQYAAIITDAYSHQLTIPSQLLTVEFFAEINRLLQTNGVAIFNMVINPLLNDPYSLTIDTSLRAVFKKCVSMPLNYADAALNVIYVCERNDSDKVEKVLTDKSGRYYTDDKNRATWDQQYLR